MFLLAQSTSKITSRWGWWGEGGGGTGGRREGGRNELPREYDM